MSNPRIEIPSLQRFALKRACLSFTAHPFASFFTVLAIGLSLSLSAGLWVVTQSAHSITLAMERSQTITLYTSDVGSSSIKALYNNPLLRHVDIKTPEQAQQALGALLPEPLLEAFPENPLPFTVILTPQHEVNKEALGALIAELEHLPGMQAIDWDLTWASRVQSVVDFLSKLSFTLSVFILLGLFLSISNTLHLSLAQYKSESALFELIGATRGFIRLPMVYRGLLFGLAGGIAALIFIAIAYGVLHQPWDTLLGLYLDESPERAIHFWFCLGLVFMSIVIGYISSMIVLFNSRKMHEAK